jgi:acyl dehydratase
MAPNLAPRGSLHFQTYPAGTQHSLNMTTMTRTTTPPPPTVEGFRLSYTAKDAILYALSIGFGSTHDDDDLRFLYEEHPEFQAVPMLGLVLLFWARRGTGDNNSVLPSFPPPMMAAMGIIPREYLQSSTTEEDLMDYPVLHTFQSITWHRPLPVPPRTGSCTLELKGTFHSIQPKSIGTFVTSEIVVQHAAQDNNDPVCTVQSTALVLGLPSEQVIPYAKRPHERGKDVHAPPLHDDSLLFFEAEYHISSNQALLYRLASGDSNSIHVDASLVPLLQDAKQPLLHGLCTLGIAARMIVQHTNKADTDDLQIRRLEGKFTKPVFVKDTIVVKAWRTTTGNTTQQQQQQYHVSFVVYNQQELALDRGYMCLEVVRRSPTLQARL